MQKTQEAEVALERRVAEMEGQLGAVKRTVTGFVATVADRVMQELAKRGALLVVKPNNEELATAIVSALKEVQGETMVVPSAPVMAATVGVVPQSVVPAMTSEVVEGTTTEVEGGDNFKPRKEKTTATLTSLTIQHGCENSRELATAMEGEVAQQADSNRQPTPTTKIQATSMVVQQASEYKPRKLKTDTKIVSTFAEERNDWISGKLNVMRQAEYPAIQQSDDWILPSVQSLTRPMAQQSNNYKPLKLKSMKDIVTGRSGKYKPAQEATWITAPCQKEQPINEVAVVPCSQAEPETSQESSTGVPRETQQVMRVMQLSLSDFDKTIEKNRSEAKLPSRPPVLNRPDYDADTRTRPMDAQDSGPRTKNGPIEAVQVPADFEVQTKDSLQVAWIKWCCGDARRGFPPFRLINSKQVANRSVVPRLSDLRCAMTPIEMTAKSEGMWHEHLSVVDAGAVFVALQDQIPICGGLDPQRKRKKDTSSMAWSTALKEFRREKKKAKLEQGKSQ